MHFIDHPSPNHDSRRDAPIDMLVLHYTGMETAKGALEKLCDATPGGRVSAHYLVDEEGKIFRLVPEERRAWHAGESFWRGNEDINARSIGIEIANSGDADFPQAQMRAVKALCKDILSRHPIPAWNVAGHSDIAPARKSDPGERFDWQALAAEGIGLWPERKAGILDNLGEAFSWVRRVLGINETPTLKPGMQSPEVARMQQSLAAYGYPVPLSGDFNAATEQTVVAFQRHFRPGKVSGEWDAECGTLLSGLLALAPPAKLHAPDGRMAAVQVSETRNQKSESGR